MSDVGHRLEELTSPDFADAVRERPTVVLPLASVEQTGRHCPLGTDLFVAREAAARIAALAPCIAAPAIPYGDTRELDFWPGSVDVPPDVLGPYVEAVARSFLRQGFTGIVFLCTHSLNLKTVDLLCRRLHGEGHAVCAIDWWKVVGEAAAGETDSEEPRGHGGEVITSVAMALVPDRVRLGEADDAPSLPGLARVGKRMPGAPFVEYGDFREYCRSGAWGRVRDTATAEKGRRWLERALGACAEFVREFAARRA